MELEQVVEGAASELPRSAGVRRGDRAHQARENAAMRRRTGKHWHTPLGTFIDFHTVNGVVAALRERGITINKYTVYDWVSADRLMSPRLALALRDISHGALTLDDIYDQRELVGKPSLN